MSALLRHGAARRLVGSMFQRAQSAVVEERRRLVPRLMHTDERVPKEVMNEIQQKKEELYDVISKADKEHRICTWWDRTLAHDLCMQVTPRPLDSNWRQLRIASRVNSVLETAGLVSLSSFVAFTIYLGVLGAEEEQAAQSVVTSKASGGNI